MLVITMMMVMASVKVKEMQRITVQQSATHLKSIRMKMEMATLVIVMTITTL